MLSEKVIRERIAEHEKALSYLREEQEKVRKNPWKYLDPEGYLEYLVDNAIVEKAACDALKWVLGEANHEGNRKKR